MTALLNIGGVDIPTPSEFTPGIMDISKAERNTNGTMIIERIATKVKLEMSWKYVTAEDLSTILTAVDPVFFEVTYLDPKSNSNLTKTFYCGDRTAPMMDYIDGVPRYKDLKFSLIQK